MLKMSAQLENIISAYKTLSKIPFVAAAQLNNSGTKINSKWSVRNLDKGKVSKFASSYTLNENLNVIDESDFGSDISNEILSAVSPQETYKALIREERNGKDPKKQYLEIWSRKTLAHSVDLTSLDKHGDVYADSEFGGLQWSLDEASLVYVAEKKLPKFESYIKRKDDKPKNDGSGETAPQRGEEFVYRQDWGEQLVGKHLSVVVLFKLAGETVNVLGGIPDSMCPGQVRFSPDGNSVVGVVWETEPRRLGLIFCTNRPSYIFKCSLDGEFKLLTCKGQAVRSPRFNSKGDLVWLQRKAGGPHHACHKLMMQKKGADTTSTLVEIIDSCENIPNENASDIFHGIYSQALPNRCFNAAGDRILFSTPQETEVHAYVYNIETRQLVDISNRAQRGSTTILDVRGDIILGTCSSLKSPGQLYVARLPPVQHETEIVWKRVSSNCTAPFSVEESDVVYFELGDKPKENFTAIYFSPAVQDKKLPLIVWPHGGPHSNFVNAFMIEAALFNMMGFACLQINYRGSTGAGENSLNSLLSRIGDEDVKNCQKATDYAIENYPIDTIKVFLMGGSHGGFLVTHLSGQYPDTYAAVVTRNPVTDVATMFGISDIADWHGVDIRSQLWATIEYKAQTAAKKRGILIRVKRYFTPGQLLTLYKAQVRSCMEYCSHLWDGSAKYQLAALDSVERRAERLIGDVKLVDAKLHSLAHRRKVACLSVFYRLYFGFASARINYRGSTGHGDAKVRSLISHVGEHDVKDCYRTLTTLIERDGRLCENNVFLYGGSYGGLVVAHLAGLYPDKFRAMVMKNPLIDLATKGHCADNSDGCAVEAGFEFTEEGPISEEQLLAMRRASPIAHVHKVKAPTAVMLGSGDVRVPHYQGLDYARRLKANGVLTKVYMYDDNHSLSSTPAEMDNLINGVYWFMQHTVVHHNRTESS